MQSRSSFRDPEVMLFNPLDIIYMSNVAYHNDQIQVAIWRIGAVLSTTKALDSVILPISLLYQALNAGNDHGSGFDNRGRNATSLPKVEKKDL